MEQTHPFYGPQRIINMTCGLLFAVLAVVVLRSMSFVFIPLCSALLICYALGIPFDLLRKYGIARWLIIVAILIMVLLLSYLLGSVVHANVREFQLQLPKYEEQFWMYSRFVLDKLNISAEEAKETLAAFWSNIGQKDLQPVGSVLKYLSGSFFSFLGNIVWVLLFMMFLLAEREGFSKKLVKGVGEEKAKPILAAADRITLAVQHYLGLKSFVSLITAILAVVILWLFGIHFAVLWGLLTFFLNFIPNIGSIIATFPPVAVALFQTGNPGKALVVAGLLMLVQLGVGNFLEPKLMGRGLDLSPLVVLLALLFWGWLWGVVGMLLAVPLTAALKIAMEQLDETRTVAVLMSRG